MGQAIPWARQGWLAKWAQAVKGIWADEATRALAEWALLAWAKPGNVAMETILPQARVEAPAKLSPKCGVPPQ